MLPWLLKQISTLSGPRGPCGRLWRVFRLAFPALCRVSAAGVLAGVSRAATGTGSIYCFCPLPRHLSDCVIKHYTSLEIQNDFLGLLVSGLRSRTVSQRSQGHPERVRGRSRRDPWRWAGSSDLSWCLEAEAPGADSIALPALVMPGSRPRSPEVGLSLHS